MARKIITLLVLVPLGIVLVVFCVANRNPVMLSFNPFDPKDQVMAVTAPFFVFLFITLILGILIGSAATWFRQGRYRKRARFQKREAQRWQTEADQYRQQAEQIAGHLPSK